MKNKDIYWRRYKKHCTKDNDSWVPFKVGTLGPHTVLPITLGSSVIFSLILLIVWNLFPFKGDFSFGKARSHRAPNLGCRGAESPGWFDVSQKNSAWDMMHEQACCCDEAVSHQLLIAVVCWIILIVSTEECSSLMQKLLQICCSSHSVILNGTATQYTCSLNGVYHPPLTSTVKSSLVIHMHSGQ